MDETSVVSVFRVFQISVINLVCLAKVEGELLRWYEIQRKLLFGTEALPGEGLSENFKGSMILSALRLLLYFL